MHLLVLTIHVIAGSVALLAGGAALSLRKGGRLHVRAGTVFFAAMLVMTTSGAMIAALGQERATAVIGLLTLYLVATSWMAARRRDGVARGFELGAFIYAASCAAAFMTMGLLAATSPTGRVDSLPAVVPFIFGAIAALAAGLDLNFILRRHLTRTQRIARHLWRMCTALLIAAFSFFLGQQDEFPEALQGSPILFVPPLAVLTAMIFWIFRVRFSRAWNRAAPERPSPASGGIQAAANV